ncbi:hypothetical protein M422DRAFT_243785 [Sphaerobolus stellatus SS14]|nr:hypothetical protein M422DRAFT_243785 [Sphaerobolus stellatus SS14]
MTTPTFQPSTFNVGDFPSPHESMNALNQLHMQRNLREASPTSFRSSSFSLSDEPTRETAIMMNLPSPTQFVDRLANADALGEEARADLQTTVELSEMKSLTHVILMALTALYRLEKKVEALGARQEEFATTIKEIKEHFTTKWTISSETKKSIIILVRDHLIDPKRLDFDVAAEVEDILKQDPKKVGLSQVFDNPSRKAVVIAATKQIASQQRSAYKKLQALSLTQFTSHVARMFKMGSTGRDMEPELLIRQAILRRFHRDFIALVTQFKQGQEAAILTSASLNQDDSPTSGQPKAKAGVNRPPRDEDYWSLVTAFFEEKIALWGKDMKVGGWSMYIAETLALERKAFPQDILASLPGFSAPTTPQFQPDLPYERMPQMPIEQVMQTPGVGTAAPSTPRSAAMAVTRFLNP